MRKDIIVQTEKWDRFDYAREPWKRNPYNPKNNVNYTSEESGLPDVIETHPGQRENSFFRTPPDFEDILLVLDYQRAHTDKFLSISLDYTHLLYCISNQTNESPLWSIGHILFLTVPLRKGLPYTSPKCRMHGISPTRNMKQLLGNRNFTPSSTFLKILTRRARITGTMTSYSIARRTKRTLLHKSAKVMPYIFRMGDRFRSISRM